MAFWLKLLSLFPLFFVIGLSLWGWSFLEKYKSSEDYLFQIIGISMMLGSVAGIYVSRRKLLSLIQNSKDQLLQLVEEKPQWLEEFRNFFSKRF